MSEIRVATWNAQNALGDAELSPERMDAALEVVKRIDADVLFLPETAHRDKTGKNTVGEQDHLGILEEKFAAQGYEGLVTDYSRFPAERNVHYMSMWSRTPGEFIVKGYGKRNAIQWAHDDSDIRVIGVHLDDRYPSERVLSVKKLIENEQTETGRSLDRLVVMGDFNDMHPRDPKGRMPRLLGKMIGGIEVDFYNTRRPHQRILGKAIRLGRMAGGEALGAFDEAGFDRADRGYQPTIARFTLDHIVGTERVNFSDFTVHSPRIAPGGPAISDHRPISTTVRVA